MGRGSGQRGQIRPVVLGGGTPVTFWPKHQAVFPCLVQRKVKWSSKNNLGKTGITGGGSGHPGRTEKEHLVTVVRTEYRGHIHTKGTAGGGCVHAVTLKRTYTTGGKSPIKKHGRTVEKQGTERVVWGTEGTCLSGGWGQGSPLHASRPSLPGRVPLGYCVLLMGGGICGGGPKVEANICPGWGSGSCRVLSFPPRVVGFPYRHLKLCWDQKKRLIPSGARISKSSPMNLEVGKPPIPKIRV